MGETKSVKVDNWGVFFLQKLQNFFNKTDYCDLTLQFRDNSQLKVHRLVLSACTDYFNVLEQTCEVVDDAIIMPNGLQADVVVPIVNFMYTGTLEFELKMYNRLLRTAKDMNMTVLLKLLEAHRRTMEMHPQKSSGQCSPKPRRRMAPLPSVSNLPSNVGGRSLIQQNQGKRFVGSNASTTQNRNVSANNTVSRISTTAPLPVRQIGSTTFTRIKVENEQDSNTTTSGSGGYTIIKQSPQQPTQQPTSPFEQLRKGYSNNKRPAVSTFVSPPAKKPNLDDVKEFAEQQRVRKQIAAEYGDDDYDANNIMDDDTIHNDDDDDEMMTSSGQTQPAQTFATSASAGVQTTASSSNQQAVPEDPPGTTTIIVKHEGPDKPPTIVVKDNSNSKMNHAKIISEVLRQYPHLVKSNKSIKLKIMPNAGGQAQKIVVKKDLMGTEKQLHQPTNKFPLVQKATAPKSENQQQQNSTKALPTLTNRQKNIEQQQAEMPPSGKSASGGTQTTVSKSTSTAPTVAGVQQKRRIDSKTMHALIALGAENTTGPWLCLRCGRNGHPISIPSYRGFRRHLINTHKEYIDPDLCEHCGWRSSSKRELHFHLQLEHKVKTNLYIFPECQLCEQMCIDSDGLNQHLIDSHPDENKQQCIYCNKIFPEEIQLYTHMKTFHKKQAIEDGIIDYSDDENQTQMSLPPLSPLPYGEEIEQEQQESQQDKVKIISDISLPLASSIVKTDLFRPELNTTAASEEYLQHQVHETDNNETKFIAPDGSEVILTAEQRKEILSQLNQEHEGSGIVMVLNENQKEQEFGCIGVQSDQGVISHDEISQATTATNEEREEDQEGHGVEEDDNQIYNEMKSLHTNLDDSTIQTEGPAEDGNDEDENEEPESKKSGTEREEDIQHLEESKESIDNLEWAENLISEHELADEVSSQNTNDAKADEKDAIKDDDKSQDEISKKLRELTGDWSEDDDDRSVEDLGEISHAADSVREEGENDQDKKLKIDEKEKNEFKDKIGKEQEINTDVDHTKLLASLQPSGKDEKENNKQSLEKIVDDSENIEEDDIDVALKSLHKENVKETNTGEPKEEEELFEAETFKKEYQKPINQQKPILYDDHEDKDQIKNEKEKNAFSNETRKISDADAEHSEEKLVKELETFVEQEGLSSMPEIDDKPKNDLVKKEAETIENTATETKVVIKTEKLKLEASFDQENDKDNTKPNEESDEYDTKNEVPKIEEFLDAVPEEKESSLSGTTVTTTTASVMEDAVSSSKEEAILSSEERVKNLISEWGDDDDDDEDNDAVLTANL